jgi:hypothetical protein
MIFRIKYPTAAKQVAFSSVEVLSSKIYIATLRKLKEKKRKKNDNNMRFEHVDRVVSYLRWTRIKIYIPSKEGHRYK